MEISTDNICRICLKESLFHFNICTYQVFNGKQLLEVINDLLHLDAEYDDGFPQFVCPECYKNISDFELFKRTAHEGKYALHSLRGSYGNADVKSEYSNGNASYCGSSNLMQPNEESVADPDDDDDYHLSYPDVEVKKEIEDPLLSSSEDHEDRVNSADLTNDEQDLDFDWQVNVKIEEGTEPIKFQEEEYEEEQTAQSSLYSTTQVPVHRATPGGHESLLVNKPDETAEKFREEPLKSSLVGKERLRRRNKTAPKRKTNKKSTKEQQGPSYDSDSYRIPVGHPCPSDRDPIQEINAESSHRLRENCTGDAVSDGVEYYQNHSYVQPTSNAKESVQIIPVEAEKWPENAGTQKPAREKKNVGGRGGKRAVTTKDRYVCDTCGKGYAKKSSLGDHVTSHTGEMKYECPTCQKRFTCQRYAERHIAVHDKPMNVCSVCGKEFQQKGFLNKHMKIHTGERNHACEVCGKRFLQNAALIVHLRVHTGETPYMCSVCGKTFKQSGDLKKHHLVTHTGIKPFECEVCGARFGSKMVYKNHLVRHGDARPFSCRLCNKSFKLRHHLMVHEKLHDGSKPHKCPMCDKHFQRADNLKVHMRSHTGEKPYSCPECGKCFTQSSSLKLHLRSSCKGRAGGGN